MCGCTPGSGSSAATGLTGSRGRGARIGHCRAVGGEPAASGSVAPVYHSFAGDQALRADVYAVLHEAPAAWRAGAEFLAAAAERFGLQISARTKEAWFRWCCAAAILDYLVDDSPDPEQAHAAFRALVGGDRDGARPLPIWVHPDQINAGEIIRTTLPSIPSADQVLQLTLELGAFGPKLRSRRTVHAYVRTLAAEAKINGWLVAACTFDAEQTHPTFPRFRRYCVRLFTFGIALDNAWDLRSDYCTGTTAIAPTILNRLVLSAFFLRATARLVTANPAQTLALIKAFSRYRWQRAGLPTTVLLIGPQDGPERGLGATAAAPRTSSVPTAL